MPQQIPLNKGQFTLVDDQEYEHLLLFEWKLSSKGYAMRYVKRPNGRWSYLYLHRFLMDATDRAIQVDHIDGNRLNNTRANLRFATRSQNQWNKGVAENNTTGFKGVSPWHDKYCASIRWHERRLHIAVVDDPILAAHLYDAVARRLFGEFARTNFECIDPLLNLDTYIAKAVVRFQAKGVNLLC